MITEEEIIETGKIQKTHALKGELNMIFDVDPEYFLEGNPMIIYYDGLAVPFYVESIRGKGSTSYLVKIAGVNSGEEASQFVNKSIYMLKKDRDEWVDEPENDTYPLVGFMIEDAETGKEIGEIEDVDDTTTNILFVVRTPSDDIVYIPATEDFIAEVDESDKIIKMKLPAGLLDINNI